LQTNKHASKKKQNSERTRSLEISYFDRKQAKFQSEKLRALQLFFVGKVSLWSGWQGFCCAQIGEEVEEDGILPTTIA
jgi:hypothetical protein